MQNRLLLACIVCRAGIYQLIELSAIRGEDQDYRLVSLTNSVMARSISRFRCFRSILVSNREGGGVGHVRRIA